MTATSDHKPAPPPGLDKAWPPTPVRDPEPWLCLVLAISGAMCFLAPSLVFRAEAEPVPSSASSPSLSAGDSGTSVTASLPAPSSQPLPCEVQR